MEQFYILDSVNLDEKTDVLRDFYFVGADKVVSTTGSISWNDRGIRVDLSV
ncbi:MAG: hypothetical protein ACLU4Q_05580 [Streptococcus thermophilus]